MEEKSASHCPMRMGVIITNVFVFLLTIGIVSLAGMGPNSPGGLFTHDMNETSERFFIEIGPASYTFSIWGLIYLWQAVWIIYSLVALCRKTDNGYFYICPDIWHPAVFIFFMVANLASVVWSFTFDRWLIVPSLIAIAAMPASLYVAIAVSTRKLTENEGAMAKSGQRVDIWLVRLLVHNGMGIYCTWVTIATLLNLAMVLTYTAKLEQSIASTVSLVILTCELVFWFTMDIFFLDRWVRYMFVPYFVVVWALVGSIYKNWNPAMRNSIFTAILLAIGSVFLVVKMAVMMWRHFKKPLLKVEPEKEKVQSLP